MSVDIPTTAEQAATNLATFESKINQDSPLNDKAFLRVQSALEAGQFTTLYKFGTDRILQVLALTATDGGLDLIGENYGIIRKTAEAAQFTIELPATNGTVIPITRSFIGDANGVIYFPDASATAAAGVAVINVTANEAGTIGNLAASDTMSITSQVPGAETVATITVILNTGTEEQTDESYRVQILDEIRAQGGGGNTADYRRWAQEVAGVARAYPYSGNPTQLAGDLPLTSPPDRTVFVEADSTIDPDGIAPQSLLDEVRDTITTDPATGVARQPLGLTDDTLFVESIIRTSFFVEVTDLTVDATIEAQVKADIETALTNYFAGLRPFVTGLDSPNDKNDTITDLTVSEVVQDVIGAAGGSATGVSFGLAPATVLPSYTLGAGELGKLGGVSYA